MITDLKKYFKLKNSLSQFTVFLFAFAVVGFGDIFFQSSSADKIYMLQILVVSVLSIVGSIYFLRQTLQRTDLNPLNIIVTCLIVVMLIHPTNSLLMFPLAIALAMVSKFIRYKNQPIFNPAAIGLTLTFYVTVFLTQIGAIKEPLLTSWWAADMVQGFLGSTPFIQSLVGVAILGGFMWFTNSFRKTFYSVCFTMTVFLLLFFTNLQTEASSTNTIDFMVKSFFNSFAFLTLVMLPEPKTSPVFPKQQIVVAVLTGVYFFYAALKGVPFIGTENAMVETILVSNLLTLFFKSQPYLR